MGVAVQSHRFFTCGQLHRVGGVLPVWFLAPFFLGVTGGLAAYVAVRKENHRMAGNLLVFGLLWSFVLGFLLWFLTFH